MEPENAGLVADHDLGRLLRVVPVAGLQLVAGDAELAAGADGDDAALVVDDLGACVGHEGADGGQAPLDGVVGEGVEAGRRRLRQAVAAGELGHAEAADEQLHQVARHGRAGDDARAQRLAVEARWRRQREQRVEHRRHPVHRRAPLVRDGPQHRLRVEDLPWVHDLGPVRDHRHQAEHEPEAVKQRWRAAQHVVGRQPHAVADEAGVVDDVVVRQHGRLGRARRAAGELQVADVVREHLPSVAVEGAVAEGAALRNQVGVGGIRT